jgi:hypothetical protein
MSARSFASRTSAAPVGPLVVLVVVVAAVAGGTARREASSSRRAAPREPTGSAEPSPPGRTTKRASVAATRAAPRPVRAWGHREPVPTRSALPLDGPIGGRRESERCAALAARPSSTLGRERAAVRSGSIAPAPLARPGGLRHRGSVPRRAFRHVRHREVAGRARRLEIVVRIPPDRHRSVARLALERRGRLRATLRPALASRGGLGTHRGVRIHDGGGTREERECLTARVAVPDEDGARVGCVHDVRVAFGA